MKWSECFIPTLKETPAEAVVPSHRLMLRAGMIRQVVAGAYTYLPLGYRTLRKIEAIVREEMNLAGAIELHMPAMQPLAWWEQTGRAAAMGDVLVRIKGGGPAARYCQFEHADGWKLDLFIARPSNYGLILMIRTGSAAFSHGMAARGNGLGLHFHDGHICRGFGRTPMIAWSPPDERNCAGYDPIETPEERDVFEALRVEWVEPEQRFDRADIKAKR